MRNNNISLNEEESIAQNQNTYSSSECLCSVRLRVLSSQALHYKDTQQRIQNLKRNSTRM